MELGNTVAETYRKLKSGFGEETLCYARTFNGLLN
jgi:hypothetical protein